MIVMKRSYFNFSRSIASSTQCPAPQSNVRPFLFRRSFRSTPRWHVIKPFILADIGEGIKEVQIIQWFVQAGARVEQFDKICEVASDKAIVEITSRYDGVIKKLHYEPDAMAQVGKALCDIDIQGDVDPVDEKTLGPVSEVLKTEESNPEAKQSSDQTMPFKNATQDQSQINRSGKSIHLATPAVRGLLKEHKLDITHIQGTGRDGRVMKEDVNAYLHSQASQDTSIIPPQQMVLPPSPTPTVTSPQAETLVSMTPIQAAMFKAMTRSLSIPHFLYSDEVDLTELSNLRTTINKSLSPHPKLSYLPFIIKAVSLALNTHPILNATILTSATSASPTPKLNYRPSHNIGIAIDTPQGLLVPVIKNVQHQTIHEIAQHLKHLHTLALSGQLPSNPHLLTGGTLTISNIGTIGGGVLSPMLVEGQSAILGVGRARDMPRFASDVAAAYGTKDVTATGGGDIMADAAKGAKGKGDGDAVRRRLISVFSWTADHRVLDGATMARFAEEVAAYLTVPGRMIVGLR